MNSSVERRNFSFNFATFTDIQQQLKNLNPKKVSPGHGYSKKNPKKQLSPFCSICFEKL